MICSFLSLLNCLNEVVDLRSELIVADIQILLNHPLIVQYQLPNSPNGIFNLILFNKQQKINNQSKSQHQQLQKELQSYFFSILNSESLNENKKDDGLFFLKLKNFNSKIS